MEGAIAFTCGRDWFTLRRSHLVTRYKERAAGWKVAERERQQQALWADLFGSWLQTLRVRAMRQNSRFLNVFSSQICFGQGILSVSNPWKL